MERSFGVLQRKAKAWMSVQRQNQLGCRDGEVVPRRLDMDVDNYMVHEQ